ncbi:hypothetical protein EVAR_36394_1 [Eumeta japonica]|uniref:Uncharacterized protein n=1 Tax=Eumeta variegata TaxID=151549 RepID=A0A4C1W5Q8_EUMVA|nr:hypothetical protein EVAR_36394_1 [Eumeta japonica]
MCGESPEPRCRVKSYYEISDNVFTCPYEPSARARHWRSTINYLSRLPYYWFRSRVRQRAAAARAAPPGRAYLTERSSVSRVVSLDRGHCIISASARPDNKRVVSGCSACSSVARQCNGTANFSRSSVPLAAFAQESSDSRSIPTLALKACNWLSSKAPSAWTQNGFFNFLYRPMTLENVKYDPDLGSALDSDLRRDIHTGFAFVKFT